MSNKMRGKLVVLSAPSGAGKSTVAGRLLDAHGDFLKLSISFTTRKPRGQEQNGKHYFFVTEEEFKSMIQRNEFLEYAHVFNKYYYGTSKKTVEDFLNQGYSVVFDVDVQGADSLKKIYGPDCITVFIMPPSFEELAARLRSRNTESPEAVEMRLQTAKKELTQAPRFDFKVINHDIGLAVTEVENILRVNGVLPE